MKSGTVLFMAIQYYMGCTGFQCHMLEKFMWQQSRWRPSCQAVHSLLLRFLRRFFSLDSSQAQCPRSSPTCPQHSWRVTQIFYPQVIESICTKSSLMSVLRQLYFHTCAKCKRAFTTSGGLSYHLLFTSSLPPLPGPTGTLPGSHITSARLLQQQPLTILSVQDCANYRQTHI